MSARRRRKARRAKRAAKPAGARARAAQRRGAAKRAKKSSRARARRATPRRPKTKQATTKHTKAKRTKTKHATARGIRRKRRPPKRAARRARRRRRDLAVNRPVLEKRALAPEPATVALPVSANVDAPLVEPPSGLVAEWTRTASEPIADYRVFKLRRDRSIHPRSGVEHPFVVLEGGDWVNVIPVTRGGNVVFVEQFRHGVRSRTLEIPGGMVDPGETPAFAAARELREETGYAGEEPLELGWIHPNPAIQNNRCWSYVVQDAFAAGAAHNEGSEDIAVIEVPLRDVPRLIAAGRITHALVVVAFQWLWLRQGR